MNLLINSPCYYTRECGVIDEVYSLCSKISRNIDITEYTDLLNTIGITPIIAPESIIAQGLWKEEKLVSLTYRMASISIHTDYELFCQADIEKKKDMIVDNILRSLQIVKKKTRGGFDYDRCKAAIEALVDK